MMRVQLDDAGRAARELAPELVALAGYVAVVWGVRLEFGVGWALIVGGLPATVGYVIHEIRVSRRRQSREG